MKTVLSMALVLGLCGFALAAEKDDPVGTWKCEYEIAGIKRSLTLAIKKDGDKLAGVLNWPDQKDEKAKDLKLKEGTLTFAAVRKLMGMEFPLEFKMKIEGDKISGKAFAEINGEKNEFELEGKREKEKKEEKKEEK